MITILHGDHIEASRAELIRLKEAAQGKDVRQLDGTSADAQTLIQSLESSSLFGGDVFVIIEQLFSRLGRQQKKVELLANILKDHEKTCDIILWESKELTPSVLKSLGSPAARLFKLPVLIFQFLDGLTPGNTKKSLDTFERLVTSEAPELVFSMIAKRMRQLLFIAMDVPVAGVADWQRSRLTTQAKSFRMKQLKTLYTRLGDIEFSIKSGASAYDMKGHLEQWLIAFDYEH